MNRWGIFALVVLVVAAGWTFFVCASQVTGAGGKSAANILVTSAVKTEQPAVPIPKPEGNQPALPTPKAEAERPAVEVVFVLDTTGSMGELIQAAKEKIWAIANTLVSAKPTPRIKMGLVAYRDRGDQYITRRTDLTSDLDAIYKELMGFQATAGGDEPESVNQALHEAVTQLSWSRDSKTYRVIFLVGDSPPHMDYTDDVKYPETCKIAAAAGIIINTVQCGSNTTTPGIWTEIALKSEGRYFRVEQSGSAILATTPFDDKLAALGAELDATRVYYGTPGERAELSKHLDVAAAIESDATVTAKARRAGFIAGTAGEAVLGPRQELINDLAGGRVKLVKLKTENLPENMQKMTIGERESFVARTQAKRARLQADIKDLAAKRQAHIEEEVRKRADKGAASLDYMVYDSVKEQAAKKGITYTDGPAH